jgi:hypothetical protein
VGLEALAQHRLFLGLALITLAEVVEAVKAQRWHLLVALEVVVLVL